MGRRKGSKNKNLIPTEERFWSKVNILSKNECWNWTKFVHPSGYGTFRLNNKEIGAHQMAWILTNGNIPKGLYICHTCDNRTCCNPNHLFAGTAKENANDRDRKGRTVIPRYRGSELRQAKMTEDDISLILKMHREGCSNAYITRTINKVGSGVISMVINNKIWKHVKRDGSS